MSNYLNKYQYKKLGFNKVGRNCKISKKLIPIILIVLLVSM